MLTFERLKRENEEMRAMLIDIFSGRTGNRAEAVKMIDEHLARLATVFIPEHCEYCHGEGEIQWVCETCGNRWRYEEKRC
jgi:hypothetical protein